MTFAPWLMKALGVVGTVAMFMVGGGILVHGFHLLADWIALLNEHVAAIPSLGPALAAVTPTLAAMLVGVIAGAAVLVVVSGVQRLRR